MDVAPLIIESDFEFSPAIVWDALTDPELVSGWLALATITPELGGEYTLSWAYPSGAQALSGRITQFEPDRMLRVTNAADGELLAELTEFAGGLRGTSTRLRVTQTTGSAKATAQAIRADWLTAFDQLDGLLRGHPVDWPAWDRDYREAWSRHFREVRNTTA